MGSVSATNIFIYPTKVDAAKEKDYFRNNYYYYKSTTLRKILAESYIEIFLNVNYFKHKNKIFLALLKNDSFQRILAI